MQIPDLLFSSLSGYSKSETWIQVMTRNVYACSICGRGFSTRWLLERHENKHQGITFACSLCDKTYGDKGSLTRHEKVHHETQGVFMCAICGEFFNRKDMLVRHTRAHQSSIDQVPINCCSYCEKQFSRKDHLFRHIKHAHGEQQRYLCKHCDKTFDSKYNLNRHILRHGTDIGKADHVCDKCGDTFTRNDSLQKHSKICQQKHARLLQNRQCSVCDRSFLDKSSLLRHIDSEHEKKRFRCENCGKEWTRKYKLKKHKCTSYTINTLH